MTVADPGELEKCCWRVEKALCAESTCFHKIKTSNFLVSAGANTGPLGHLQLHPLVAVLPPCAWQMTSLLLVDMYPVYIGEIARSCSKSISVTIDTITHIVKDDVIAEAVVVGLTLLCYRMLFHLVHLLTSWPHKSQKLELGRSSLRRCTPPRPLAGLPAMGKLSSAHQWHRREETYML